VKYAKDEVQEDSALRLSTLLPSNSFLLPTTDKPLIQVLLQLSSALQLSPTSTHVSEIDAKHLTTNSHISIRYHLPKVECLFRCRLLFHSVCLRGRLNQSSLTISRHLDSVRSLSFVVSRRLWSGPSLLTRNSIDQTREPLSGTRPYPNRRYNGQHSE
jgi:hypothetical protein